MQATRVGLALVLGGLLILVGLSCSRFPPPPKRPKLDPGGCAGKAMAQFDANHDGKIDAQERQGSPAMVEFMETADTDGDGALSEVEIAKRVVAWLRSPTIIETQSTVVTLDGNPVEGAEVTYEPEKFLSPPLEPAVGTTDSLGMVVAKTQDPKHPGIHLGLYRVRISKKVNGQESLLPRYNTDTILAKEIAPDAPSTQRLLKYDLSSDPNAKPPTPAIRVLPESAPAAR